MHDIAISMILTRNINPDIFISSESPESYKTFVLFREEDKFLYVFSSPYFTEFACFLFTSARAMPQSTIGGHDHIQET